jgi:hypothetical protein
VINHTPFAAAVVALSAASALARPGGQIEIEPSDQDIVSSSYYPIVNAAPRRAVDGSGLSFQIPTGAPVPAVYPTHDTDLANMYWSGSEANPMIAFSLGGTFTVSAMHYWNENEPADGHGQGHEGPARGMRTVAVAVSTTSILGPYSSAGSVTLAEASGDPAYTGDTVNLPAAVTARFIRFQVLADWGGDFAGLAEIRFIGTAVCTADFNGDGQINVADFLAFLSAYSAGAAAADLNADGQINISDFLAYLSGYAAGC